MELVISISRSIFMTSYCVVTKLEIRGTAYRLT